MRTQKKFRIAFREKGQLTIDTHQIRCNFFGEKFQGIFLKQIRNLKVKYNEISGRVNKQIPFQQQM